MVFHSRESYYLSPHPYLSLWGEMHPDYNNTVALPLHSAQHAGLIYYLKSTEVTSIPTLLVPKILYVFTLLPAACHVLRQQVTSLLHTAWTPSSLVVLLTYYTINVNIIISLHCITPLFIVIIEVHFQEFLFTQSISFSLTSTLI